VYLESLEFSSDSSLAVPHEPAPKAAKPIASPFVFLQRSSDDNPKKVKFINKM
jgi:hypothetical protein